MNRTVFNIGAILGGVGLVRFLFRRLLFAIPTLFLIVLTTFILIRLIPGGPFSNVAGRQRDDVSMSALIARYGLDKPLLLNLPNDGVAPDSSMKIRTPYESRPKCEEVLAQKTTETRPTQGFEEEEGWALLRWTTEHKIIPVSVPLPNGSNQRVLCEQVQTVLYSDLFRSQFFEYVSNVLRLDFGPSLGALNRGDRVSDIIARGLPNSMLIGILATIFGFSFGIPLGVVSALFRNKLPDYVITFLATIIISVPSFVLGPTLIILFVNIWNLLPGPTPVVWLKPNLLDGEFLSRLILPLSVLVMGVATGISRLTRTTLLQVLQDDYIRTARSKGLRERTVLYVHALKNALIPVATVIGPFLASILTGTLFVERIFDIPGLGGTFLKAIGDRDYTLLTGTTILYSSFLIVGNIMVDVMYTWLDPRIQFD